MRRTSARQAILESLFGHRAHVTADALASEVQSRFPGVNESTVYRTLTTLEEIGVVDHVHLGHGPAVYHLADNQPHQHLVCDRCAKVEDIPFAKMAPFLRMLQGEFGFALVNRHFAIVGRCTGCQGP